MDEGPRPQSWWRTLPGILTALAGIITAATGLTVAVYQIGSSSGTEKASPEKPGAVTAQNESKSPPTSPGTPTSQTPSGDGATQQALDLPAGMEATLTLPGGGDVVYKILSARLEPSNAEKRRLTFTVRLTNNDRFPQGFLKSRSACWWTASPARPLVA